ncbi:MAG: hypothetical protein U0Q18_09615 [Bryobacteraceae bacterium]
MFAPTYGTWMITEQMLSNRRKSDVVDFSTAVGDAHGSAVDAPGMHWACRGCLVGRSPRQRQQLIAQVRAPSPGGAIGPSEELSRAVFDPRARDLAVRRFSEFFFEYVAVFGQVHGGLLV